MEINNKKWEESRKEFLVKIKSDYLDNNVNFSKNPYHFFALYKNFVESILLLTKNITEIDKQQQYKIYHSYIGITLQNLLDLLLFGEKNDTYYFVKVITEIWESLPHYLLQKATDLDDFHREANRKIKVIAELLTHEIFGSNAKYIVHPAYPEPDGYSTFSESTEQLTSNQQKKRKSNKELNCDKQRKEIDKIFDIILKQKSSERFKQMIIKDIQTEIERMNNEKR